jgi:ATP-binding cassette, subfamily B, bacterial MsbA
LSTPASTTSAGPAPAGREFSHGTWPLMRRLTTEFVRPHFGKLLLAFLTMGVVAGSTAANAWMMQPLMDKVFVERNETLLLVIPAAVIGLALVKGFAGYAQSVWMTTIGQRIVADIQLKLFARLMRADLAYFHANPTGTLI